MDFMIFFNLAGYLFWPILLIGIIVFIRNPKLAWQNSKAFLNKIFRRGQTKNKE